MHPGLYIALQIRQELQLMTNMTALSVNMGAYYESLNRVTNEGGDFNLAFIQEPRTSRGRIAGIGETKGKIIY